MAPSRRAPVSRLTEATEGRSGTVGKRGEYSAAQGGGTSDRGRADPQNNLQKTSLLLDAKTFLKQTVGMNDRLDSLHGKVEQVLAMCQSLRSENLALRGRVAGLEGENKQLAEKITSARQRLEALMSRLPES